MRKIVLAMSVLFLPAAAWAQPMVQSQEGIALENQILQLQSQVQQLQAGGGGNGGSSLGGASAPAQSSGDNGGTGVPSSVVTNLLTEVQQLQSQIQDLNGRVDTLQNQVNTQNAQIEKDISDLKFQMGNGGAPGAAPSTPGAPGAPGAQAATQAPGGPAPLLVPATPKTKPEPAAASPKLALHAAQEAILRRDYPAAEQAARGILATAKGTPAGYQAQYILAQSLYGEGKPQDSAIAFDDTYNRDRSGSYAPGALLGLANSLSAIHQDSAACDTLASLNSQFPTPPKGMGPAIAAAAHRAHCS